MSLTHAILGFLSREPMTGYDLKTQCFDKSVSNFWPADQAQIYRTLDKMEADGWVVSHIEIQQERPNRKWFRITDSGRVELNRWLHSKLQLPIHREPFLVQLFFSELLTNETIREVMQYQRSLHEKQLARYELIDIPRSFDGAMDKRAKLASLTLKFGKMVEEAYIEWLTDSLMEIE